MLSSESRNDFQDISKCFQSVFNRNFGVYNDKSGPICININSSPVEAPTQKGKLPFFNSRNLQQLQEEADKLEKLEVLAKPEDMGVNVKFVSPSFVVKKPGCGFRLLTVFNNPSQYVYSTLTATMSCEAILRRLSIFKYVIKLTLPKASSKYHWQKAQFHI